MIVRFLFPSGRVRPVIARSNADREVGGSNPTLGYREFLWAARLHSTNVNWKTVSLQV